MKPAWQIKKIDGMRVPVPFCDHATHALDDFKINQVVTSGAFHGTIKGRSLTENNLYFSACKTFRDLMMPDPRWEFANVDYWFRYHLKYFNHKHTLVMPDGGVHFQPLPLNFKGCKEAQANGYYTNAFRSMGEEFLGVESDVFINEVKNRMVRR